MAAIATASGAPAGTLYHRFGNRDGILSAARLRALERFQSRAMGAEGDSALDTAVAMAVAAVSFARNHTEDARLLLTLRPTDLLDGEPDTSPGHPRRHECSTDRPGGRTRPALFGSRRPRAVDAVSRAVVDLPYAVVRRHAPMTTRYRPGWRPTSGSGCVALLTAHAGD